MFIYLSRFALAMLFGAPLRCIARLLCFSKARLTFCFVLALQYADMKSTDIMLLLLLQSFLLLPLLLSFLLASSAAASTYGQQQMLGRSCCCWAQKQEETAACFAFFAFRYAFLAFCFSLFALQGVNAFI